MKPRRDLTPYMNNADSGINAALTLLKVYKRIRAINPAYKPPSRYQARLKNNHAGRCMKPGMVR